MRSLCPRAPPCAITAAVHISPIPPQRLSTTRIDVIDMLVLRCPISLSYLTMQMYVIIQSISKQSFIPCLTCALVTEEIVLRVHSNACVTNNQWKERKKRTVESSKYSR